MAQDSITPVPPVLIYSNLDVPYMIEIWTRTTPQFNLICETLRDLVVASAVHQFTVADSQHLPSFTVVLTWDGANCESANYAIRDRLAEAGHEYVISCRYRDLAHDLAVVRE